MSLAEPFVKPSTMLYRNFLAMEAEELLRSHPIDGAVLLGGCDKTTPGLIMGAISMGIPAIYVPAGPMLRGNWRGAAARLRLRRMEILDREARRQHHRGAMERDGGRHRALLRHLHGDGHRRNHDGDRRGARPHAARRLVASRRPTPAIRACAPPPAGASSTWCGRTSRPSRSSPRRRSTTPSRSTWRMGGSTNAIIHVIAMARRAGIALDMAALRRDFAGNSRCSRTCGRRENT